MEVLPLPVWPTRAMVWPGSARKEISWRMRRPGVVAKGHVAELDVTAQLADGLGGDGVAPIGFCIEEAEDALGADDRGEGLGVLVAKVADRLEEHVRLEEELDDGAERGLMMEDAPAAKEQKKADEELAVELEEGKENRAGPRGAHIVAGMVFEEVAKERGVGFLAHKALGHANAGDGFGEGCGDAREAFLRLRVGR